MTKEALSLSDIVAANSLMEQGILPGNSISEAEVTPSDVAEATRSLIDNVNSLPLQDDQRKDRVLGNAAERVGESVPLLDSDAIRRAIIVTKTQRAYASHRRVIIIP